MIGFRKSGGPAYGNEEDLQPIAFAASMTLAVEDRHYNGWTLTGPVTSDFTIALTGARMFEVGYIALQQDGTGGRSLTAFTSAGFTLGNPDLTGINTAAFKTANIVSVIQYTHLQVAGAAIVILNTLVGK